MATRSTTKKAEPKATTAKTANVNEAPVKNVAAASADEPAVAETKKETVKSTAAKKSAEKATTKKTTAAKAAPKKAASKTAKAAAPANTEVYVQFWGKEVYAKDVVENVKKIWTEELGKKEADLKDLKVYIKPEDNGAHYVINGEITGFLPL